MRAGTLSFVLLGPLLMLPALGAAAQPSSFSVLGDEIVRQVGEQFYDAARAGRWVAENRGYAAAIADRATFRRETARRLAALGASHTAYYTEDDVGFADLSSIFEPVTGKPVAVASLGVGLVQRNDGWFVAQVFAGGPGETAGLRRGDRLAAAGGAPFDPVLSLRGKVGVPVALAVERARGAPPIAVVLTPAEADPKAEWLAALEHGAKIVERSGRKVGTIPVWSCAGQEVEEKIGEAISGPLATAEALILDLRGGWGGCDPHLVQRFVPVPPELVAIGRDGTRHRFPEVWDRPLVVLIDGGSRSGKEVVARALQRLGRATLVGEPTAGAVLAGRFIPLSDGSILYLAVSDITVDGERLEGRGVVPDIPVPGALPYAAGADPQLERALEVAAARLGPPPAPAATPGAPPR